MKAKIYLFILLAILLSQKDVSAFSALPPVFITGKVITSDGNPLPGVSVLLKGTRNSVVTNQEGNYRISTPDGTGTLVFSYIGFQRTEMPINSRKVINITLKAVPGDLDEVVVVGYGTQTKRDITGSISSLKASEIEKYNVNSFQSAMQGQMAGVEMYESSGVPGAAVNVRIRGLNTINGSAGPLYVVDGVPVFQGGGGDGDSPQNNGIDGGSSQTNVMTDINPNDIESIEVLKDAASSAIYGARGSGGVILITTKRGKAGKSTFNVNLITGYSKIAKEKQLLNGPQLLEIFDEAYKNTFYSVPANANLPLPASPLPPMAGFTRGMADTTNNNAFDHVLQTGIFRELTLSAMNGTEKTKYYLSGTYKQSVATIQGSDMNQFNFKLNFDQQLSKVFKLGVSVTPSYNVENRLGSSNTINLGGYGGAMSTNLPIYPYYNADGSYFNPWTNPEAFKDRSLFSGKNKRSRISGMAYLEANIAKGLTFKTLAQREDWNQIAPTYMSGLLRLNNSNEVTVFANDQKGYVAQQNSYGYSNSFDSYFTYNKVFKKHNFSTVLGMRFSSNSASYEAMYGDNLINSNLIYPSLTARVQLGFQTAVQEDISANLGYYLRTQYKFKERYLLTALVNRDGSSRFGGEQRFGTFPAFSAGWIASDEPFMKKTNKIISFLKFRGSFGFTGNSAGIGNLSAQSTWQSVVNQGYMGTSGNVPIQPANAQLHWEKGTKFDAAVDFGFLKNRISGTFDFYKNTTNDMLLSIPTSLTYGYYAPASDLTFLENRGSLNNRGVEFTINANVLTGMFKWRTTFNITHNETKILSLGGLDPNTVSGGSGDVQLYPGNSAPVFYLVEFAGVDPVTGGELVRDKNNNVVLATSLNGEQLNAARKPQYDKPPAPKFYGGFGNTFSYKAFSLNLFFSYRYGNYLLDAGERVMSYVGNITATNNSTVPNIFLGNLPTSILNRWTPENTITDIPKVYYNDLTNNPLRNRNTTRFLSDASFIRLKNVQFSYAVPERLLVPLKVKSVRFNVTGQNLLLFTKFKGLDPEAVTIQTNYRERNIAYGIIRNTIPQTATLTFGLSVGF